MALSRLVSRLVVVLALLLTGCASGAGDAPPTGVDQLDIPTPSPDPGDFVATIDNPWLPLTPGAEWVYELTGDRDRTVTVTVADDTREVAGVAATEVTEAVSAGKQDETTTRWYAQDTAGNVWLLGEDGVWEAGLDGAQAGLAMPAMPRLGDGFVQEYAEGVAEDRSLVVDLDESADLPLGEYDDLLVLEQRSPLVPGYVELGYYAEGVGLIYVEVVAGGAGEQELVEVSGVA